ncbi:MAG: hypothetical protein ACRD2D_06775, partial [Terriglobales bacterium]
CRSQEVLARELGSSEWAATQLRTIWGVPPALELEAEYRLHQLLAQLAGVGAIGMARPVGPGGIAVALAKACLSRSVEAPEPAECGLSVNLPEAIEPVLALFGERGGEVIVTSAAANLTATASAAGLEALELGTTRADGFEIAIGGRAVVKREMAALAQAWNDGLVKFFRTETEVA